MNTPYNVSIPGQPPINLATGGPVTNEEQEALVEFMTQCELTSLNLLPNFQFKYLSGPSGFSASVGQDRLVNADLLRCDLFRVISCVKIKPATLKWFEDTSKEIEYVRTLFPLQSPNPPSLAHKTHPQEIWIPSLGGRQTSISICNRMTRDEDNRQIEELYLVCHTSLPDAYLNDIQEQLELISSSNYEFKKAFNTKGGNTRPDVKPVDYASLVQPGGLLSTAREIAIVNNQRAMDIFSQMTGLQLEVHMVEQTSVRWPTVKENEVKSIIKDNQEGVAKLDLALNWWPKGVPVFPFSVLPSDSSLGSFLPQKEIQGFPIGALLTHFHQEKPDTFERLQKKYQIVYQPHPRLFEPTMRTIYNTYTLGLGHTFHFHSMASPTSHDFLMYEGVDLGYKIFAHHSLHLPDWKNAALDSFPTVFPFKEETGSVRDDLVLKCFTPKKGGHGALSLIPEQLQGRNIGTDQLPLGRRILNTPDAIQLHPLKVFLSPDTFNISSFPGDSNNYY